MFALAFTIPVSAGPRVYDDGSVNSWSLYDAVPFGASASIFQGEHGNWTTVLVGYGLLNGFLLGGTTENNGGWNDTTRFTISWKMRANEPFRVIVAAQTDLGLRYFVFDERVTDIDLNNGKYIHGGLGPATGRWTAYRRDLLVDLADREPDNALIAIHGILIRGNVRIDDVTLHDDGVQYCST